ncbi:MAG: hypothetical protein QME07_02115 [bacterium]|nr:hypothetical protein [bacterium]
MAGVGMMIVASEELSVGKVMLGMGLMTIGPAIGNHFCGDRFARWTVERNKKFYKQFDYQEPSF